MIKTYSCLVLAVLLVIAPITKAEDAAKAIIRAGIDASFSEAERQVIQKYFGDRVVYSDREQQQSYDGGKRGKHGKKGKGGKGGKGMPPGLAKRGSLPPGLSKLQKQGSLPPGLARKNLPSRLERQLPPAPEGYERQIIEDAAVVLINKATGKIADIVKDATLGD